MRAVLAHSSHEEILPLRRTVLQAGWECERQDCVAWDELEPRLAAGQVDLLLLETSALTAEAVPPLCHTTTLTSAPKLVVSRQESPAIAQLVPQIAAAGYIATHELPDRLLLELQQLQSDQLNHSGTLYVIYSPTAGVGVTTIAVNLADALLQQSETTVAVLELSHQRGRLALQLDLETSHTAEQVCQRWQELDLVCFRTSLMHHTSGLQLLPNRADSHGNASWCIGAARRLAILTRSLHGKTVVALGNSWDDGTQELLRLADRVLLVTRPEIPSLHQLVLTYGRLREAGLPADRMDLLVNYWGQPGQLTPQQIESTLSLKPLAYLPDDPAATNRAANRGCLLRAIGRSRLLRKIDHLATTLRLQHAVAFD